MATFGTFPGVKINTTGGAVTGVAVGRENYLVLVGNGNPSAGSTADANTAVQPNSPSDADTQFGADTELAVAIRDAIANDANLDYLYGVMPEETSVSGESVTQSDTLQNTPVVEDSSLITVTDTSGTDPELSFRYDSRPTTPSPSDEVYLNPSTGEIEFGAAASGAYEVDYTHLDWSSALAEAANVFDVEETGIIVALDEAESVATTLQTEVSNMRGNYKMAVGHSGAEHNSNSTDNGPSIDTASYADSIDDDAYFLAGPARLNDDTKTMLGASAGLMASKSLTDSIYDEAVQGISADLEQNLSKAEADDLRDNEVIPVRQTQQNSPIVLEGNLSTSTESDWVRDYYTRRIVDRVVLIAKTVGEQIIGRINSEDTRQETEDAISAELRDLARRNLIKSNTQNETNHTVTVYEVDANEVGIDIGVTPTGIIKRADVTVTINTP